jgi:hypothetical protein
MANGKKIALIDATSSLKLTAFEEAIPIRRRRTRCPDRMPPVWPGSIPGSPDIPGR